MKRIRVCLGVLLALLMALASLAKAREILVPDEFQNIQSAIDSLKDGDFVLISKKFNRVCNKMVTVKGKQGVAIVSEKPLIFTNKIGAGISIEDSDVRLENISFVESQTGIEAANSNVSVKKCEFRKNKIGILAGKSVINIEGKNSFIINFMAAILLKDLESFADLSKSKSNFQDNCVDLYVSDDESGNYKTGARIKLGR